MSAKKYFCESCKVENKKNCKDCRNIKNRCNKKQWVFKNREKETERLREYWSRQPAHRLIARKEYMRDWRKKNRVSLLKRANEWKRKNRNKISEANRVYFKKNPWKIKLYNERYKDRKSLWWCLSKYGKELGQTYYLLKLLKQKLNERGL